MRILHVTDRLSARGGADQHLLALLSGLASEHELWLAVGRSDGSVTVPPCSVTVIPGLDDARDGIGALEPLERLAARVKPDIVHFHNAIGPALLHWAARCGAVMTVQDHRCFCPGRGKWRVRDRDAKRPSSGRPCTVPMAFEACAGCLDDADYARAMVELTSRRLRAIRAMRRLLVLSAYMKRELVAVGVDAHRVVVIPPPVYGLQPAAAPSGSPCVLFAGRLVRAKGVADAVQAWLRSGVGLPLVFAGSGPERAGLERHGLEVLGWVPHEEMTAVYRRARALLLPSRWQEPFGIVGVEALSVGVPVVAWESGGVGEWHPAGDPGRPALRDEQPAGSLVGWGDIDALAVGLAAAAGHASASPSWGVAASHSPAAHAAAVVRQYRLASRR